MTKLFGINIQLESASQHGMSGTGRGGSMTAVAIVPQGCEFNIVMGVT